MVLIVLFSFGCILSLNVNAENIVRHSCGTEGTFYKIASNYALNEANAATKTTSEGVLGCIEFCVKNESCKAFNYKKVSPVESLCELLQNDRNTKETDVAPRDGWSYYDTGLYSSQIGQRCRNLSYNPCYPCLCIDSCYSGLGYSCNCTHGLPSLPDIYTAFETTVAGDSKKSAYDRGQDMNGNKLVTLLNGAMISSSVGRPGRVLRLYGTNAGAVLGNFYSHSLNNPADSKISISLWLRIASPQSGVQTIFGAGRYASDSGVLLRVTSSAKAIYARSLLSSKHLTTPEVQISDTLQSWTHVALTSNWISPKIVIYLNGLNVAQQTTASSYSISTTKHPNFIFGAGSLFSLINDHWDMHIDDFAFWDNYILTPEEVAYVMNKGFV
ncbi:uncharacterized protein LOC135682574 isoform X2 [Rhopilema esculentum]|uniref:uncharacterized protein LOC135682574 isoform X2 n=1 Tax=Rhopilema esculentum TaxID=499914 RepID=UPI0031D2071E